MKILRSCGFAWNGIRNCFVTQLNFRIHILGSVLAVLTGFGLKISSTEWLFVLFCIAMVLVTEMINTGMEKLCDLTETGFHPAIRIIKDIAAGAVLVSAIASLCAGIMIFLPKILGH